jgi:alpha-D-xyloside xylohydrolase
VRYHREGIPPFRALVMDHPEDARTWAVDDQFMVGESLLVAPVVGKELEREVYLPEGEWYDYWSGRHYDGKLNIKVSAPIEQIPIFVKSGTLLPLAQPTLHTADPLSYRLTAQVYGAGSAKAMIYQDDGGAPAALSGVRLSWDASGKSGSVKREGATHMPQYEVTEWKTIG